MHRQVAYDGKCLQAWNISRGQPTRGGPPALVSVVGLTTLLRNIAQGLRLGYVGTITQRNMDTILKISYIIEKSNGLAWTRLFWLIRTNGGRF
jgi:hypothetical protein